MPRAEISATEFHCLSVESVAGLTNVHSYDYCVAAEMMMMIMMVMRS